MRTIQIAKIFGIAVFPSIIAIPVWAEDGALKFADHSNTELNIEFGYSRISIDELVFNDTGDSYLSHLRWNAEVPIVTFGAAHRFPSNWTISGNLSLGLNGNADLTNHDWVDFDGPGPFTPSSEHGQWTHQSQHPNSDLSRYIDLDLAVGRDFKLNDTTDLNLHGGLKYSLVEMDSHGGSYVYSRDDFRDSRGTFPNHLPVISYQQWHRTVFAGAELRQRRGAWQFSGLLRAGLSLEPRDVDQHWLREEGRGLRFDETFDPATFAQIQLGIERQFKDDMTFYAKADYQKYFEERGVAYASEIETGQQNGLLSNQVGADLSVTSFSIGISRNF